MAKKLLVFLFLLLFAPAIYAQSSAAGNITATSASCIATACISIPRLPIGTGTVSVTLSGSWSATLAFEQSGDYGVTWVTASPGSATANGTTQFSVSALTAFRVRASAFSSGPVNVTILTSPASTSSSSSASTNAMGPVINVTNASYGASPSTADNATAFAAVAAAANAAASVSVGTPTIRAVTHNSTLNHSSFTIPIVSNAGDTVLIFVIGVGALVDVVTVNDGTNTYAPLNNRVLGPGSVDGGEWWGTPAGGAKAFTGNVTVTDNIAGDVIEGFAVVAYNVGTYGWRNVTPSSSTIGTSATPASTLALVTQDNNNLLVAGSTWFFNGVTTVAANSGTLQDSFGGTSTTYGGAIATNQPATPNTATESVTVSQAASTWISQVIELRSTIQTVPTVYFPVGTYNYTSGLSFTKPVTLKGEKGTWLCYMGNAHAVDFGPSGLSTSTYDEIERTIDSVGFTCGGNMTEGLYFNQYITNPRIRHNTFYDFGNAVAYAIFTQVGNYVPIVEANFAWQDDNIKRNFYTSSGADSNSLITHNTVYCQGNPPAPAQCSNPGIAFVVSGQASIIEGNNIEYFVPDVLVTGNDIKISNNYFEINVNAASSIIQFGAGSTIDGLRVLNNYNNSQSITAGSFVGPADGTSKLTNADISDNTFVNFPATTPIVALNNLTGQTGNISGRNHCTTSGSGGSSPCPIVHTAGGNINQWNNDYAGTCTMNGSTGCPAYSFGVTYTVAPKCSASWNGTGTLTGLIKAATSTSQLTITSTVAGDTAVINWTCAPESQ